MPEILEEQDSGVGLSSAKQMVESFATVDSIGKMSIDSFSKLMSVVGRSYDMDDRRRQNRLALRLFHQHHRGERRLRLFYAAFILLALFLELAVSIVALFLIGAGSLRISRSIGDVFFVGVFAQVITLASIVVKALFPRPDKDMLTQLMDLLNNSERNGSP
jgi:ABC-type multidrug transport system fused ATPase/permease subunit